MPLSDFHCASKESGWGRGIVVLQVSSRSKLGGHRSSPGCPRFLLKRFCSLWNQCLLFSMGTWTPHLFSVSSMWRSKGHWAEVNAFCKETVSSGGLWSNNGRLLESRRGSQGSHWGYYLGNAKGKEHTADLESTADEDISNILVSCSYFCVSLAVTVVS